MIMRHLRFILGLAVHLYATYMNSFTTTYYKTQFSTYNVKILYIIVLQLQRIWPFLTLHSSHHDCKTVRPSLNHQNKSRLNDICSIQQNCPVNFIWVHSGPVQRLTWRSHLSSPIFPGTSHHAQPPIQYVLCFPPGGKPVGASRRPLTFI